MRSLLTLPITILGMASLLALGSTKDEADSLVSYDADPHPEGEIQGEPETMLPQGKFSFSAQAGDQDTVTILSSGSCKPITSLAQDDVSASYWTITDPGAPDSIKVSGLQGTYTTAPWYFESEGEGEYGACATTMATFICDDGREESDPCHDHPWTLGTVLTTKLIPDDITTELGGPYCIGGNQYGQCFEHTVQSQEEPDMSFGSMVIQEEIVGVLCGHYNEEFYNNIRNAAKGIWTIEADNSWTSLEYPTIGHDCHVDSANMAKLLNLNEDTGVLLMQVYRIISHGWPEPNPDHRIGKKRNVSSLNLSGIHCVEFDRISPTFTRVTKDGINCGSDESTCD